MPSRSRSRSPRPSGRPGRQSGHYDDFRDRDRGARPGDGQYHPRGRSYSREHDREPAPRRERSTSRGRTRSGSRSRKGPSRSPEDGKKRKRSRSRSYERSRSRDRTKERRRSKSRSRSRSRSRTRRKDRSRSRDGHKDRDRERKHKEKKRRDSSSSSGEGSEDESRKKKKHKRDKSRERRKKEKKEKKKKKSKVHADGASWGKYGIISELDLHKKTEEFNTWLVEERVVNPETLSKDQQRKEFARFVEDFNTATLPHEKFYNMDTYLRRMTSLREGELLPPSNDMYDPSADLKAINSAHKKRPAEHDTYLSKEQLQELRRVQNERIQVGKMKRLGMDVGQNMGVRMDGTVFDD